MDLKLLKLTPRRKQLLEKMSIFSVEDLLKTYPMRYETKICEKRLTNIIFRYIIKQTHLITHDFV